MSGSEALAAAPVGSDSADLESARRVLRLEASALDAMSQTLDPGSFTAALDVIERMRGRVIVSGMGKSGHVARKIAATLASTGTPALFVHPAEASHGDLGMIAPQDVVVVLSNSGETPELADLVTYVKRFGIPMIAITGVADSALGRSADVLLTLPSAAEACPLGLAPTTSTTLMLGLGDSLAVAMLERKGFSSSDFQVLHPGGKLARRLLRVADIMHGGVALPLVPLHARMSDALIEMTAKGFGCVGIRGPDGALAGVVTDGDLRRHMSEDLIGQAVVEIMTPEPKTITADALASEALRVMNESAITNMFVLDGLRPEGILHIHDCLRAGVA